MVEPSSFGKNNPITNATTPAPESLNTVSTALVECLDTQLDEVFGSLDEPERTETLRLLAKQVGNRYEESTDKPEGLGLRKL
jgi:hypothetical protein